jgi:hypothetical protein
MRRPQNTGGDGSKLSPPHYDAGELAKSHPRLAEALTKSTWEDGTPKRPAEVLIHCIGRSLFATLKLKGTGYQLQVEVPEPLLVYDALEAVLSLETPPWQDNPWDIVPKAKKGKKE